MVADDIKERLNNLYLLREKLCEKQKKEIKIEEITTWIIDQLNYLKALAKNENVDRSEIIMRINDIIFALNVEEDDDE